MNEYHQFNPDLIIEATSVCDRRCPGCYAPNLLTQLPSQEAYRLFPDRYLNPQRLDEALIDIAGEKQKLQSVAIRGGEPSLHPDLGQILKIAHRRSQRVYLETHGRWISREKPDLLKLCQQEKTIVKVSFDKMHGLPQSRLQEMTSVLAESGVAWAIAITEPDEESLMQWRRTCRWISDHQIIFQVKATAAEELIRPKHGVVQVSGRRIRRLTTGFIQ